MKEYLSLHYDLRNSIVLGLRLHNETLRAEPMAYVDWLKRPIFKILNIYFKIKTLDFILINDIFRGLKLK